MTTEIKMGTWWIYVGPGDGKWMRHLVTGVDGETITTWSEFYPGREFGGFSWMGSPEEFRKVFKAI
jgi:hypothetical protein